MVRSLHHTLSSNDPTNAPSGLHDECPRSRLGSTISGLFQRRTPSTPNDRIGSENGRAQEGERLRKASGLVVRRADV